MANDRRADRRVMAPVALLAVTVLGTMSNNIVNVPLRQIALDLAQPVQATVLAVLAFSLVLAVTLPLAGWLGDRFGRKLVLCVSIVVLSVGQVAAALAPNLPLLIVARGVQGLGCSGIPPLVMGLLVTLRPHSTARMMGAWAAANGVGQAIGPPVGGIVSDVLGWRWIFLLTAFCSAVALAAIIRTVPAIPRREATLHMTGALLLTLGAAVVLVGLSAFSQQQFPRGIAAALVIIGVALVTGFLLASRGNPNAMIPVRYIIETRFVRSAVAGFAHMFALGTALVAVPLFLTGPVGLSTSAAGTLFFALPVTMTVAAPLVGHMASGRLGPRPVLRLGLLAVVVGAAFLAWFASLAQPGILAAGLILAVVGVGIALVQTPAATGANRSPAGRYGAALGLYNLVRFSGSTVGAAWVALLAPGSHGPRIYLGVAAVAVVALIISFVGPNPPPLLPSDKRVR